MGTNRSTDERNILREKARKMVSTYCDAREAGGKPGLWEKYDLARHAFDDALTGVYSELERLRPLLDLAKSISSHFDNSYQEGCLERMIGDAARRTIAQIESAP